MSRAWRGGSTRAWRKIRAAVLAQNLLPPEEGGNNGQCGNQIPGVCTGHATCVHHTLGRNTTGDDPRYLVPSCNACNQHIGDPTRHTDPAPKPVTRW